MKIFYIKEYIIKMINNKNIKIVNEENKKLIVLDLFCGCGGMTKGLYEAGF